MYWEVMRRAVKKGIKTFDYGRSKKGTGSYHFKRHWGFEPKPLYYEFYLVNSDTIPDLNPLNPKYKIFIAAWKHFPLSVSQVIGPWLAKDLG
jgi:lipid II:glycine glycyltransferase (peptidoglycan interpeptide bridge formation enzyme)